MSRPRSTHPTDGELAVLQVLWQAGPCGLGQIATALRQRRPVATTTVATVLNIMRGKKLVRRQRTRHGYLWSAKTTRQSAAAGMVRKLLDSLFDGSAQRLVAHLLESGALDDRQRKDIRRLIDAAQQSDT